MGVQQQILTAFKAAAGGGGYDPDFNTTIGSGLRVWLAARKLSPPGSDGSTNTPVASSATALSSNFTATSTPTFETSEINGYPTYRGGTGTKTYVSDQTWDTWRNSSTSGHLFLVMKVTTAPGTSYAGGVLGNGGAQDAYITVSNGSPAGLIAFERFNGSSVVRATASYTVGTWMIVEARYTASDMYIAVNGGAEGTVASSPAGGSSIFLFGTQSTGGLLDSDVAEFLFVNSAMASLDRTTVRADLGTIYGITTS